MSTLYIDNDQMQKLVDTFALFNVEKRFYLNSNLLKPVLDLEHEGDLILSIFRQSEDLNRLEHLLNTSENSLVRYAAAHCLVQKSTKHISKSSFRRAYLEVLCRTEFIGSLYNLKPLSIVCGLGGGRILGDFHFRGLDCRFKTRNDIDTLTIWNQRAYELLSLDKREYLDQHIGALDVEKLHMTTIEDHTALGILFGYPLEAAKAYPQNKSNKIKVLPDIHDGWEMYHWVYSGEECQSLKNAALTSFKDFQTRGLF